MTRAHGGSLSGVVGKVIGIMGGLCMCVCSALDRKREWPEALRNVLEELTSVRVLWGNIVKRYPRRFESGTPFFEIIQEVNYV